MSLFHPVFDTWAKFQSGILHGNLQNPGHFTECVKFRHEDLQGQHCMVSASPAENITVGSITRPSFNWPDIGFLGRENGLNLGHGFCLPASCSPEKVINYTNDIFLEAGYEAVAATCRTNDRIPFKAVDVLAMLE